MKCVLVPEGVGEKLPGNGMLSPEVQFRDNLGQPGAQ